MECLAYQDPMPSLTCLRHFEKSSCAATAMKNEMVKGEGARRPAGKVMSWGYIFCAHLSRVWLLWTIGCLWRCDNRATFRAMALTPRQGLTLHLHWGVGGHELL